MPAIIAPVFAVAATAFSAVGAVAAGVGAFGAALGITGTTLLGVAASVALIGVEYLLRPSTPGGQPQIGPVDSGQPPIPGRRTIRQSDTPRSFIFGRTRTAGAYLMYETDGYLASVPANSGRTLYQGIYICDGPVDGFDAFICDDETSPIIRTSTDGRISDGSSNANVYGFTTGMKGADFNTGSNKVWGYYAAIFEPVNATEEGYYPAIFSSAYNYYNALVTAMWPTTCLGKGMTCVYAASSTLYIAANSRPSRFPSGFPEWTFCVRGARVYDPRDATQTETQGGVWTLYNTTWKWTENPALIAAHFVSWLIDQNLTAITGVDWDSIAAAADDCDAIVSATMRQIEGGAPGAASEPFARMTGIYYFTIPPREFLSKIMAACDGTYSTDQNGRFTMWIGKWEDPAVTFDESDVSSFTEEFLPPTTEAVNEIHSTYVEPQNSYQRFEAPVWTDDVSIARIGRRLVSINYDLVPSPNQAYRLSQRYARRINGKRKLNLVLGPRGMLAFKQRVVGLNLPSFGIEQSTWRVETLQPEGNLTRWSATLREITTDVFDDDPAPRDPATTLTVATAFATGTPNATISTYPGSTDGTSYVVISINGLHQNDPTSAVAGITTADVVQEQTLVLLLDYSLDDVTYYTATTYLSNYVIRTPDLPNGNTVYLDLRFMAPDGSVGTSATGSTTI